MEDFQFAYRISPILAKVGCSAAECHGGATGQGGFKLSLFADNPRKDYEAITQEVGGRRVDYANPANSLFLKKPTRHGVKHKGGRVLREDDLEYRDLLHWIELGAPFSQGRSEELTGITMRPTPGGFSVVAAFRDATGEVRRDVTRLALFQSTNEQVATVDELGQVTWKGRGEAWILARLGRFSARGSVTRPFSGPKKEVAEAATHALDRVWLARLNELGLEPARRAPDATLLRRLYFTLAGRPPSPYEQGQFYHEPADLRVIQTIDQLIQTPEFDRVFASDLAEFFEIPAPGKDLPNDKKRNDRLRRFFLEAVRQRTPVSSIVERLLTDPKTQMIWRHLADPRDRAEYVGRTMLGIRIGCARCHNHPLDRWTNQEHLQFSAFFSDLRPAPGGGMMAGKFFLPGSGRVVEPVLLPLGKGQPPPGLGLEGEVSWFVLKRSREQFARNVANRLFERLIGIPLVDLPDDHRMTNPAIHEPVLGLLSRKFLEYKTRLRPFVRFIVSSRLYAASSEPPDMHGISGDPQLHYLARRTARPLTAGQFKRAVECVCGAAIDSPNPPDSPLARQLYLLNSGLIQKGLNTPGNQVDAIFDFETEPESQFGELYRLILSRKPRKDETERFLPLLIRAKDPRRVGKDLAFALMASREFGSVR